MRVLLTGGYGFLGSVVYNQLVDLNEKSNHKYEILRFKNRNYPSIHGYDIREEEDVAALYRVNKPDIVIHMAARVGGIGINRQKPGTFYYENMKMGLLMLEYAQRNKIKKIVNIGTICAYPKDTPVPFKESDLWNGYPEETNAPYGLAKKMLLVQSQAYRQEFGLNSIYLLPVNLYGPGDNFNPDTSHVIPALIKKFEHARINKLQEVEVWGTGNATREFLYVTDAAEAIISATLNYNEPDPLNIGTGQEISIRYLAELIRKLVGYEGKIIWNANLPDGQPRRCLDVSKAKEKLGFTAKTCLEPGLMSTIEYYRSTFNC